MWSLTVEQEEKIGCYRELQILSCYGVLGRWKPRLQQMLQLQGLVAAFLGRVDSIEEEVQGLQGAAFAVLCKRKLYREFV